MEADDRAGQRVDPNGLRITLLGSFGVGVGAEPVPDETWRRRKPAALLKILALAPGHRVHRERLMDLLWPELELAAAGANLRKAIHQARSALDDASRGAARLIEFQNDVVALAADGLIIDADSFLSALTAARRSGEADGYRSALAWYAGDLLPDDPYEEWADSARRELHDAYVGGLSEWCAVLEASGDIESAMEVARTLVAAEPTREESHAGLMRLYGLAGRRSDALRQYDHLSEILDHELGVEASAQVQRLREEINARRSEEPEFSAELWERVGDLRVLAGDGAGAAKAFARALAADQANGRLAGQEGPAATRLAGEADQANGRLAGQAAPAATGLADEADQANGGLAGQTGQAASMLVSEAARLERKCAEAWLMQHRPDMAGVHLEAAAGHPADRAETGRVLRARANLAWETGQIPAARQFAEEARDIAVECGTADDLAAAHEAVAIVSHFEGEWREGLESELERLAGSAGDGALARVFDLHHCIGQYHLYGDGLFESVEGYARRILDRAEEAGAVRAQAFAWCLLGESLLLQARWEESDGCLERSCLLHDSLGSRSPALPWQRRAELAVCQGRFAEVDAYLRRAAGIATVSPLASHAWGRIHATAAFAAMERGDPPAAVHAVQAAAAAAARYGDCPTCSALLNPIAAEAYAWMRDADNARYYRDAASRVAGYFSSSAWRAMAESAAGSVRILDGDRAGARDHFGTASELYAAAGQPFWAERSARQAA